MLGQRVAIEIDDIPSVAKKTESRQVGQSPGPSKRSPKLAGLGLRSLIGVGPLEGDATG